MAKLINIKLTDAQVCAFEASWVSEPGAGGQSDPDDAAGELALQIAYNLGDGKRLIFNELDSELLHRPVLELSNLNDDIACGDAPGEHVWARQDQKAFSQILVKLEKISARLRAATAG